MKGYILSDFNYVTFLKRWWRPWITCWQGYRISSQSMEDFLGPDTILLGTIVVDTCHYTLIKIHRTYKSKSEPCVNYGLWAVILCQGTFSDCDQCAPMVWDANTWEGCVAVRTMGIWQLCTVHLILLWTPNCSTKVYIKNRHTYIYSCMYVRILLSEFSQLGSPAPNLQKFLT